MVVYILCANASSARGVVFTNDDGHAPQINTYDHRDAVVRPRLRDRWCQVGCVFFGQKPDLIRRPVECSGIHFYKERLDAPDGTRLHRYAYLEYLYGRHDDRDARDEVVPVQHQ